MKRAPSSEMLSRVKHSDYHGKIVSGRDAIAHLGFPEVNSSVKAANSESLQDGSKRTKILNVGMSGFTSVSNPKIVPRAIADYVKENKLEGQVKYNLYIGASTGPECDDTLASLDMIESRTPYQLGKAIQGAVNSNKVKFHDQHLSTFPERLVNGTYNSRTRRGDEDQLDVAVIEATEITEDGHIVPGVSVGASPEICDAAKKIIIEVNTKIPSLKGLHDITQYTNHGHRKPMSVTDVSDRMGNPFIKIDPKKVVAIVESDHPDSTTPVPESDEISGQIAGHILEFFAHEVRQGRMPPNLFNLQSGIGGIANQVIGGLKDGDFHNVKVFTEVLQDTFLDYFDTGKLLFANSTSIRLSPDGFDRFFNNYDFYAPKILLRNQSVSNSPELIQRLGVIAMNTPVEVDIYGHGNSTHISGSKMISGLGGSNDFLRNSRYSILHTPSTRATRVDEHGISTIVPFASHIDSTEHDVQFIVTENGLADLRGLHPVARAKEIIDKCVHPVYKDQLNDYLEFAIRQCEKQKALHQPHALGSAFKMHVNLQENGTMRLQSWD